MIRIKNARICDGTGAAPFMGEVLIEGERIQAVSPQGFGPLDVETIDGGGRLCTPGFIDAHRHCDLAALYDPSFGELELSQGITTAVMGNCGLAPAPCVPQRRQELYRFIEPCLGPAPDSSFFPLVSDFIRALEGKPHPLNLGVLGATGAVTTAVKGYGPAPFDTAARQAAEMYIRDAMEAGALGLSCGIMYTPECYSTLEDFAFMAKICGQYGGFLTSHIRGEGNSLTESVEEVIEIGRRAQVPVNISHFKVTGLKNHGKGLGRAITAIERARALGRPVTADAYPYTGGSTTALSLIPPAILEEAAGDLPGYLSTPRGLASLAREIEREQEGWDNMVASIGWGRIIISGTQEDRFQHLVGLDLTAAAHSLGLAEAELLCQLIKSQTSVILMSMAQADVDRVLCLPWVSLISDALYSPGGCPHPRLYGAFPKFLREYAVERGLLPLGQAVHKMTGLPAQRLGLKDRGLLAPGYYADLLLFDPHTFTDHATWKNPAQQATGLDLVLVNGQRPEGLPGKVLKRP